MNKRLTSITLILAVLLSACAPGNTQPTAAPTAAPTTAPTTAPTVAPTMEPTKAATTDPALTANPWLWIGLTDPAQQIAIDTPANYTLTFQPDGTVAIKADCNNAAGSYTIDRDKPDSGALTIAIGPMTLAACPPDSRSDQFVKLIGSAARYFFKDGNLYIDLEADGGTLTFASPAALGGDDSIAPGKESLQAQPWQWTSFTGATEQFDVADPQKYTATFVMDGSLSVTADCNSAAGSYTTDREAITIAIGPMTMAACPPDSRSDQFVQFLGNAVRYFFKDGKLIIDLLADGGTMTFAPVKSAASSAVPNTTSTLSADLTAQLDRWLQSMVSSDPVDPGMSAPGIVLLVDTPQGRYLSAAGVSSVEKGTAMKPDDRLEIGSNTKSMTVALLMQLQAEGVLSLADPLSKWLPEWAAKIPNGDKMTLWHLAQHTAGLWDYGDDVIGAGISDPAKLEQSYTPEQLVQYAIDNGKPYFAPEEGWKYSNTGYILLGLILEKATGQSLRELYQQRIFDPLGLQTATFIEGVPQSGAITTDGYYWDKGQRFDVTNWNASQGWAAGGVAMNAADLATYADGLAARKLFTEDGSLTQILTFDADATLVAGTPYGLGLMDFGDGYWGHGGQTAGFQSLWYTDPASQITVVGLSNSGSFHAHSFLNVRNILNKGGALPVSYISLLPELSLPTYWQWLQQTGPTGVNDINPGTVLVTLADGKVRVRSEGCNTPGNTYAWGTYTSTAAQRLAFKFDAPDESCKDPGEAKQLIELLASAAAWQFKDGQLAIELAADGGTLLFKAR